MPQRNKHRKDAARRRKQSEYKRRNARRNVAFIEGMDSYEDAYERLKVIPPLGPIGGIFEVPDEVFYEPSYEARLTHVGLDDYSPILFSSELGYTHDEDREAVATGYAMAALDAAGNRAPVILLRSRVSPQDADSGNEADQIEFNAGIRLLVLIHELGHADDLLRGLHFDYDTHSVNLANAETHAHVRYNQMSWI